MAPTRTLKRSDITVPQILMLPGNEAALRRFQDLNSDQQAFLVNCPRELDAVIPTWNKQCSGRPMADPSYFLDPGER